MYFLMPKDEWDNVISDAEYDHIYHGGGWYNTKDEWGNIVKKDDKGNQLDYDPKTGKNTIVKTD